MLTLNSPLEAVTVPSPSSIFPSQVVFLTGPHIVVVVFHLVFGFHLSFGLIHLPFFRKFSSDVQIRVFLVELRGNHSLENHFEIVIFIFHFHVDTLHPVSTFVLGFFFAGFFINFNFNQFVHTLSEIHMTFHAHTFHVPVVFSHIFFSGVNSPRFRKPRSVHFKRGFILLKSVFHFDVQISVDILVVFVGRFETWHVLSSPVDPGHLHGFGFFWHGNFILTKGEPTKRENRDHQFHLASFALSRTK